VWVLSIITAGLLCVSAHWSSCDMISTGNVTATKKKWCCFRGLLGDVDFVVKICLREVRTSYECSSGIFKAVRGLSVHAELYFRRLAVSAVIFDPHVRCRQVSTCVLMLVYARVTDLQFVPGRCLFA
jgi:hypothetical protein